MTRYGAIVLAAGQGTRFQAGGGRPTKLIASLAGIPLVCHAVEAALASQAAFVTVVTGHDADAIEAALSSYDVALRHNADFASGLASTLQRGFVDLPPDVAGVVVLLGDMPRVDPALIDRLIGIARTNPDADAVVPTREGRQGNPVLLARSLFPQLAALRGDVGARHLLRHATARIVTVAAEHDGILVDVDRPGDLHALNEFW